MFSTSLWIPPPTVFAMGNTRPGRLTAVTFLGAATSATKPILDWYGTFTKTFNTQRGPETLTFERAGSNNFANHDDFKIARLYQQACAAERRPLRFQEATFPRDEDYTKPDCHILLVRNASGDWVGSLYLLPSRIQGIGLLATFAVDPAYQGCGVGGFLLDHQIATARALGYEGLILTTINARVASGCDDNLSARPGGLADKRDFQYIGSLRGVRYYLKSLKEERATPAEKAAVQQILGLQTTGARLESP